MHMTKISIKTVGKQGRKEKKDFQNENAKIDANDFGREGIPRNEAKQ